MKGFLFLFPLLFFFLPPTFTRASLQAMAKELLEQNTALKMAKTEALAKGLDLKLKKSSKV